MALSPSIRAEAASIVPRSRAEGLQIEKPNSGRAIHTVVAEITSPGDTKPTLNTTSSDAWKIGYDHD